MRARARVYGGSGGVTQRAAQTWHKNKCNARACWNACVGVRAEEVAGERSPLDQISTERP